MKKSNECQGNPRKRKPTDEKWSVWLYPIDPATGKKKQKVVGGFATLKEAETYKQEQEYIIKNGKYRFENNIKMSELLDRWLAFKKESGRKQNTIDGYKCNIESHIKPFIGGMAVKDIQPEHLVVLYNKLKKGENERGELVNAPLSQTSVLYIHNNLCNSFAFAVRNHIRENNPAQELLLEEKPKKGKFIGNPLTETDFCDFVKALITWQNGKIAVPILMCLTLGLRRGECLGVKYSDLNGNNLHLVRQIVKIDEGVMGEGDLKWKSEPEERELIVPDFVMAEIDKARKRKIVLSKSFPKIFSNNYITCDENGGFYTGQWLYKNFKTFLKDNEQFPVMSIHDLRRTYATILNQKGISIEALQKAMGHGSKKTTEIYILNHQKADENIAKTFDAMKFAEGDLR